MELNKSDLLIIGAGPGGYEMAAEAASKGLSVTLIERDKLGGTCLNQGCIPTKALCRSAEVLELVNNAAGFGVDISSVTANFKIAQNRKNDILSQLRDGISILLSNVNVVKGEASFIGNKTLRVGDDSFTADNIVIATGSKPVRLPIPGAELAITSNDVLSMESLPESMIIIGGGVIGLELAYILNAFGVSVTIVEYCKEILSQFDSDIAKRLRQQLSRKGIRFITSASVKSIEQGYKVVFEAKNKIDEISADSVLMATGRCPVYPAGIEKTDIELFGHGIKVDESMQTSVSGVYAIGDVNGLYLLAHAATAQGRIALSKILSEKSDVKLGIIPSAVYTVPELAMVGIGEFGSHESPIIVRKAFFRANGKALALGETDGLVKIITDDSDKLLGCQVMGPHAADLVQEIAAIMAFGASLTDLKDIIHCHPTLSEVLISVK